MGCGGSKDATGRTVLASRGSGDGDGDFNPLSEDEVNARIVCSPKAELFKLGDSGITLRYAYLSQRGYYPEDLYKANQDAFKVIPQFNGRKDQIFFGVFDGHGVDGDSCSYFVRDNIEGELKQQLKNHPDDFEKAYKEAFVGVNNHMHEQVPSLPLLFSARAHLARLKRRREGLCMPCAGPSPIPSACLLSFAVGGRPTRHSPGTPLQSRRRRRQLAPMCRLPSLSHLVRHLLVFCSLFLSGFVLPAGV